MKPPCLRLFLVLILWLGVSLPGRGAEIWFSPRFQKMLPYGGGQRSIDYSVLFKPGAPWQVTAAHLAVFKINAHFVKVASDRTLDLTFRYLKDHRIKLALEMGMLTATPEMAASRNVEGFFPEPQTAQFVVARIKAHGGMLDYVAMDEPYWYGALYDGGNATAWPASRIAANAAQTMKIFQAAFPNVKLGDIEPVTDEKDPALIVRYAGWIEAMENALGQPLAFFHADIVWKERWRAALAQLPPMLAAKRVPLGIIYNAPSADLSNARWLAAARQHYEDIENNDGIAPDQAIFQSWSAMPDRLLPETEPDTHTNLVFGYLRGRVNFTATRNGSTVAGLLRDAAGQPIAGVPVRLEVLHAGPAAVPDDAAAWTALQTGETDPFGKLALPLPANPAPGDQYRLEFPGDAAHRGARTKEPL